MSDSDQKYHVFLAMASKAGWAKEWTGGNCTALTRTTPAGTYMITLDDDPSAPESDDVDVELGMYDANDGHPLWGSTMSFNSTTAAMAAVNTLTDKE